MSLPHDIQYGIHMQFCNFNESPATSEYTISSTKDLLYKYYRATVTSCSYKENQRNIWIIIDYEVVLSDEQQCFCLIYTKVILFFLSGLLVMMTMANFLHLKSMKIIKRQFYQHVWKIVYLFPGPLPMEWTANWLVQRHHVSVSTGTLNSEIV